MIVIDDPLGLKSAEGILEDESRRFPGRGSFRFNDHTFAVWPTSNPRGDGPPSLQVTRTDTLVLVEWYGAPGGRGYRLEVRAARPEEVRQA